MFLITKEVLANEDVSAAKLTSPSATRCSFAMSMLSSCESMPRQLASDMERIGLSDWASSIGMLSNRDNRVDRTRTASFTCVILPF